MHACNAPYLHFCQSSDSKTEPKCTSTNNKKTPDLNYAHSLMSMPYSAFSFGKYLLRAQAAFPARNEPPKCESSVNS